MIAPRLFAAIRQGQLRLMAAGMSLCLCQLSASPGAAMDFEVEEIGLACRDHYVQAYDYLRDGVMALNSYSMRGGQLMLLDPDTGKLDQYDLPVGTSSWHIKADPDDANRLWMTTLGDGALLCFDRLSKKFVHAAALPGKSEEHACTLDFDADKRIYVGSVPTGKLYRYDPKNKSLEDLGVMSRENQYVRDVLVGPTGLVFGACGCERCAVVVYNPRDGSMRSLTPDSMRVPGVPMFTRSGDVAFMVVTYGERVTAYDLAKGVFLYEAADLGDGRPYVDATVDPRIVRLTVGGQTRVLCAKTGQDLSIPCPPPALAKNVSKSGKLYGLHTGGPGHWQGRGYYLTDPETNETEVRPFPATGNGQHVTSLCVMSDGVLSGSGQLVKTVFRLKRGAKQTESLGIGCRESTSGQFYGLCEHEGKLYMAGYHETTISVYDPSKPWDLDAGNPRLILKAPYRQHRPEGGMIVGPNNKLYLGTQPQYGYKGGALCIFDPATETIEVHRNLVPNQSVQSVATDGKRHIFGGTSVVGGGLVREEGRHARFFVWDCEEGMLVFDEEVPAREIGSIAVTLDGRKVYVPVDTAIRIFAAAALRFAGEVEGRMPGAVNILSGATNQDGRIYFGAKGGLVMIDPAANKLTAIESLAGKDCRPVAASPDGSLYTSANGVLYRIRIRSSDPPSSRG